MGGLSRPSWSLTPATSRATMRIGVPLAASLGSTGAVGIFVGRHGRIRADSRDSARSCRVATSSGSYLLGDRRTETEEDGAPLQTSALPLGYGAVRRSNFAGPMRFLYPSRQFATCLTD